MVLIGVWVLFGVNSLINLYKNLGLVDQGVKTYAKQISLAQALD